MPAVAPATTVVQPDIQSPQVALPPDPASMPSTALPDTTPVTAPAVGDRPATRVVPHTQPEKKSAAVKETATAVAPARQEPAEVVAPATRLERKPVQVRKIDSVRLKIDVKK
jgi:hypothetical protein